MKSKKTWLGTGWKMNHMLSDAESYAAALLQGLPRLDVSSLELFICPPYTLLYQAAGLFASSPLHIAAQNCHWEDAGAATGEISARMIKDSGADMIEIGHSERRASFGETDITVNRKVLAALRHGLRPLVCIGETGQEKQYGIAREVLARQVKMALHDVPVSQFGQVLLAYEPVWAIGEGGVPADPAYASETHAGIRQAVAELSSDETAQQVSILYGGSVNPQNAAGLVTRPDIDGLFIGRSAWQADSFLRIIELCLQALQE